MKKNKKETQIDLDLLTEKVYRLMLSDLKISQARQGNTIRLSNQQTRMSKR
jgi:hypothetical protein